MVSCYGGFFLKTGAFVASATRSGELQETETLGSGAEENQELELGCYQDPLECSGQPRTRT